MFVGYNRRKGRCIVFATSQKRRVIGDQRTLAGQNFPPNSSGRERSDIDR
ncbi:MAG: hypothetical protein H0T80_17815 [Betaproteobacteria bacterium]|nr:hypothetical protein [Betaproteobacteria bacterium]